MRDLDDQERREQLRKDPRRDPTDPPPANKSEQAPSPEPDAEAKSDTETEPVSKGEEPKAAPPASEEEPPSSRRRSLPRDIPMTSEGGGRVITSLDPRVQELEPLVAEANWEAVLRALGTEEEAGKLPPNLGLIYALAHKEHNVETQADKAGAKKKEKSAYDANVVAIRCMAGLFGVPPESPIALVLGKRLIRSNPVGWQKKKAPPAHISVLIVALGLAIGAGIGWLLSFGYVTFKLPSLPFLP
jgi:hypothetical protein